jgi:hypothetical protein
LDLTLFLFSFLQDHLFCVHISNVFSALHQEENGASQESILNVTVFCNHHICHLTLLVCLSQHHFMLLMSHPPQFPKHLYYRTEPAGCHKSANRIFLLCRKDTVCTLHMITVFSCSPNLFLNCALPFTPAVKLLWLLDSKFLWEPQL